MRSLYLLLMMEETNMAEFASKGVAGTGLGLGIAGTALGLLNGNNGGNGGLLGILNGNNGNYVSQNELAMSQALAAKDSRIGLLESQVYVDQKIVENYTAVMGRVDALAAEVRANKDTQDKINLDQAVYNGTNNAALGCMNERIAELKGIIGGITKTVVPNDAICPGWGPVRVILETATTGGTT